jgi:hypothetical protein
VSTQQHVTGPPPVGFLRRIVLLLGLIVGLAAILVAVLGGSYAVETYLLKL